MSEEEEKRVIGRGVEKTIRKYIEEEGGECEELAIAILETYAFGGQRALRELLEKMLGGVKSGNAEET